MPSLEAVTKVTRVATIERTCEHDPAQWEGKTEDGAHVYARYRHGVLRVSVARDWWHAVRGVGDLAANVTLEVGPKNGGAMTYEELKNITAAEFSWPESEA